MLVVIRRQQVRGHPTRPSNVVRPPSSTTAQTSLMGTQTVAPAPTPLAASGTRNPGPSAAHRHPTQGVSNGASSRRRVQRVDLILVEDIKVLGAPRRSRRRRGGRRGRGRRRWHRQLRSSGRRHRRSRRRQRWSSLLSRRWHRRRRHVHAPLRVQEVATRRRGRSLRRDTSRLGDASLGLHVGFILRHTRHGLKLQAGRAAAYLNKCWDPP